MADRAGYEALRALDWFREETVKAGYPGLALLSTIRNRNYMAKVVDKKTGMTLLDFINKVGFDGVTHYQFFDFAKMNRPYPDILKDVEAEWKYIDETIKAPYFPQVSLGWDSNPRYNIFHDKVCTDNTPKNVQKGMQMAKDYVDSHDLPVKLITVNSWNEWTEGNYLHPDTQYGYGFLEAVKKMFME